MGVSSFDGKCLREIERLGSEPHLSILVGAGASIPSGLPGWGELVRRLIREGKADEEDDVAGRLLESQGALLAAEAAFPSNATREERVRRVARALSRTKIARPRCRVVFTEASRSWS